MAKNLILVIMILAAKFGFSQPPTLRGSPLYYEGIMRHLSCTGEFSDWGVQLYLEQSNVLSSTNKNDVRLGIIFLYPKNIPTGSYRQDFIYMVLRVDTLAEQRALRLVSRSSYFSPYIQGYGNSGGYVYILQTQKGDMQLSGSMRSNFGTKGTLRLSTAKQYRNPPLSEVTNKNPKDVAENISMLRQLQAEKKKQLIAKETKPEVTTQEANGEMALNTSENKSIPSKASPGFINDQNIWDDIKSSQLLNQRVTDTLHRIVLSDTNAVVLKWYDNATTDGDSISVFVDDVPVLVNQLLSSKPLEMTLKPGENKEILIRMVAENLGSIPPNTALMIIETKQKTYRLPMQSDMARNGSVLFIIKN